MKRKFIAVMLSIMILSSYIPMFCGQEVQAATEPLDFAQSVRSNATTVWEYNFTGAQQNFQVPYKRIYKIEAYGAQEGVATRYRFSRG